MSPVFTLSLGERENRFQSPSRAELWIGRLNSRVTCSVQMLFPLPKGGGQDERKESLVSLMLSLFRK
jgi:hypothetical protein